MRSAGCLAILTLLALGVPTVFAQELPDFPFEVPEDNGWYDYARAVDIMQAEDRPVARHGPGRAPLEPGPEELAEWKNAVEANADVLALIAEGVAKESVIPPQEALQFDRSRLNGARSLSIFLVIVARYRVATDDRMAAAKELANAVEYGQDIMRGGILIHRLVGIACEAIALSNIHDLVMNHVLDAEALRLLAARLDEIAKQRPPLSTTAVMEQRYMVGNIDTLVAHMVDSEEAPQAWRDTLAADREAPKRQTLGASKQLIEMADQPYWEATEVEIEVPPGPLPADMLRALLQAVVPVHKRSKEKDTAIVATFRGVRLMVALELHRLAEDKYPATLKALSPEFIAEPPEDPFSGESFIYVGEQEPYRLYSVGPNMIDDGGAAAAPLRSSEADLVFNIQQPPPAPPPAPPPPVIFGGPGIPGASGVGDVGTHVLFVWLLLRQMRLLGF